MRSLIALIGFLIILSVACKTTPPAVEKAENPNLRIAVTVEPAQPRMDKPFTVRAHVLDDSGAPVTGAKLTGTLAMKTMDHGNTDFELTERGHGVYEGISKVEMSGDWNLKLTATKASDSAVQDVPISIGD